MRVACYEQVLGFQSPTMTTSILLEARTDMRIDLKRSLYNTCDEARRTMTYFAKSVPFQKQPRHIECKISCYLLSKVL